MKVVEFRMSGEIVYRTRANKEHGLYSKIIFSALHIGMFFLNFIYLYYTGLLKI